jgi:hypothetical protein
MAFGTGTSDDASDGWVQKPSILDLEPQEPATRPRTNPRATAPPQKPPEQPVDDAYIAQLGRASLNVGDDDLDAFIAFSQDDSSGGLRASVELITSEVLSHLQDVNLTVETYDAETEKWRQAIKRAETNLNQKSAPPPPSPSPAPSSPPIPGAEQDPACTSVFDTNDLALRGRKAVLEKRYHVPVIWPEVGVGPDRSWAFGQKLEYRQEWRHQGFTLGDLISSLSLLPGEELTLEVSSWQKTKSEISEEQDDATKDQLEREQKRTDEESCTNEAAANNSWQQSASGSVSYGPVSVSASASQSGSTDQRSQEAEKHINEATSKATHEVSRKRAVKMTQTAEAGSEAKTTRRIKNPNACHTVTFNFFHIVKLFDIQLRVENDAPVLMLPGIFPAFYTAATGDVMKRPVQIPYWLIESFTSPAVFLTQFFEVDRDLSEEIHGWALRVPVDPGRSERVVDTIRYLAAALAVWTRFCAPSKAADAWSRLARFIADYLVSALKARQRTVTTYGPDMGRVEQVTTPGIYCDSLMGRCTACEAYVEASRYVDVMRQEEERGRLQRANELDDLEVERRQKLLAAGKLDPFEPAISSNGASLVSAAE